MSSALSNVAVIGAGLGGCAIALALATRDIPVTVYEYRRADAEVLQSGVLLTPNGLRVLDALGVFARIRSRCWLPSYRVILNDRDETLRKTSVADDALYGYTYHRIWRKLLLEELRLMLGERGVPIHYSARFTGVTSDTAEGPVSFTINDDPTPITASLVIASDGLHSSVRGYVAPGVKAEYTGIIAILSHIRRADVAWPWADYERNGTIQGGPGALIFLPEDPEEVDIIVGLQTSYPEQSRADLDALQRDPDRLVGFFQKDYEAWGPTARKMIDEVVRRKETAYAWPYMRMPKLERWFSESGRVILMGDGAHAVPPSSAQGVNQALEDAHSLVLVLMGVQEGKRGLLEGLKFWQALRQKRIDAVYEWTVGTPNVERLPEAERQKLVAEGKIKAADPRTGDNMSWLHSPQWEADLAAWIDGQP